MKKILIIILTVLLLVGCSSKKPPEPIKSKTEVVANLDESFSRGNNIFAWSMFKELNREDTAENIFFSPNSISMAMTMTYEGAVGNTADEIKNTLGYSELDKEGINRNYTEFISYLNNMEDIKYDVSNSIWFAKGKIPEIDAEFEDVNKAVFNADMYMVDFGLDETIKKMNKWASDSTEGKIEEMVGEIDGTTVVCLANAVYFKGDWEVPFDIEDTDRENFNNLDGEITQIDMMNIDEEYSFYEDDDLKAIKIPYSKNKMSMHCILPKEGNISDTIENMTEERWSEIKSAYERQEVKLKLPKFESAYEDKLLNDSLQNLGIVSAFSHEADFSGMGADGLSITEVRHSAVIEVNEEGSVAAAVTAVIINESGRIDMTDKAEFFADKPFIYLIEDEETGNILFVGVLKDMK